MYILDFLDQKVLQDLQNQFSDSTGLAAIAVDSEGKYITEGSNFTDFCMKYTRESDEGKARCERCDRECKGTYDCHAGLMDFASDIIVNGQKVGTIVGGQVLPEAPDLEKFRRIAGELGIDEEKYIEAVQKVPVKNEKSIRAAAKLLGDMVNTLANINYKQKMDGEKIITINSEIKKAVETVHEINVRTKELESIASKQNILALNASIEAARVGEAGVGFAVVANQMGELSKKSSGIYSNIKEKTDSISDSIQNMNKVLAL